MSRQSSHILIQKTNQTFNTLFLFNDAFQFRNSLIVPNIAVVTVLKTRNFLHISIYAALKKEYENKWIVKNTMKTINEINLLGAWIKQPIACIL